jgi:mRNA interferase RelE/StbE
LAWKIEYTATAKRALKKLDKSTARRIVDYMAAQVGGQTDPRSIGKALTGVLGGYWRYRVGNYRVICNIDNNEITVLVLRMGHRREVYD